jgi:hypothetical protein
MAQQILGADGSTVVKVDPTFGALRYTPRPLEALGWYQVAAKTGALTGISAASAVFTMRQINSSTQILIRKVQIGFITTTGYTAAQFQDFGLIVARSYTASETTGSTAITITGNNTKLRTSFQAPTSIDCRIATTGAITGGTKTLDANYLSVYGTWHTATTPGLGFQMTTIFDQGPGDYPLVLSQNEGIYIAPLTAMGAGGVGILTVMVEFAEVSSYT